MVNVDDSDFDEFVIGGMDTTFSSIENNQSLNSEEENVILLNISESESENEKRCTICVKRGLCLKHPISVRPAQLNLTLHLEVFFEDYHTKQSY